MQNDNNPSSAQVAFNAGTLLGDPKTTQLNGVPYAVLPEGASLVNLESLLEVPARKRANVFFTKLPGYLEYVNAHSTAGTLTFATSYAKLIRFSTVIDYHEPGAQGKPGWREHKAEFVPERSEPYEAWKSHDAEWLGQADLAEFLQDRTADIVTPDGATVLEMVRELVAKKNVFFRSAVSLRDGMSQFTYDESMTTSGGKGQLVVPETFDLSIPVLAGGPVYPIKVRLRYRIDDAKLRFRYDLVQRAQLAEQVADELVDVVRKGLKSEMVVGELR